jgi:hypothetical protein
MNSASRIGDNLARIRRGFVHASQPKRTIPHLEAAKKHAPKGHENLAQGGAERNPGCAHHRRPRSERAEAAIRALESTSMASGPKPILSLFQSGSPQSTLTQGSAPLHPGLNSYPPSGRPLKLSRIAGPTGRAAFATMHGYLLLEVILGLAILTIVVALVFRIIQTTVRVTTDVQFLQSEQEHADGLYELLRKHFGSLPQTTQFQTRRVRNGLELVFLEVPFHFSWASGGPQFGSTVIAARQQPDGRYTLAVVQEPEDAPEAYAVFGESEKVNWVPIVSGLLECNWRFFDAHSHEWKTEWRDPGMKPALFECTFEVSGQSQPTRAVFRWPIAPVEQ